MAMHGNEPAFTVLHTMLQKIARIFSICSRLFLVKTAFLPIVVVLTGVLLHAGFSMSAGSQGLILGGPIPSAEASEAPVTLFSAGAESAFIVDELIGTPGPIVGLPSDSVAAETIFGGSAPLIATNGERIHVVRPGETVYSISTRYGLDQQALAKANRIVGGALIVGDELVIPAADHTEETYIPRASLAGFLPAVHFIWPLAGAIGPLHGHNGRDIPAPLGAPIKASGPGVVIDASYGWNGGYGNRVIIDHSGHSVNAKTLYSHLQDFVVTVGQTVATGDIIGFVGSTGRSTGPHLHFEVR